MTDDERKEITQQMGRRVSTARVLKGLSPEVLAARSGLTCRRLKRFEAGRGQVTADELVMIARILKLPLWFFFEVPILGSAKGCPDCRSAHSPS
jgi:transcriptional regulator with XRE-family HTH domain